MRRQLGFASKREQSSSVIMKQHSPKVPYDCLLWTLLLRRRPKSENQVRLSVGALVCTGSSKGHRGPTYTEFISILQQAGGVNTPVHDKSKTSPLISGAGLFCALMKGHNMP